MKLYHVSEDPNIELFEPRRANPAALALEQPVVWAIDEDHLGNYLLPRDCPRICLRFGDDPHIDDIKYFDLSPGRPLIYIESDWANRIKDYPIYVYAFNSASFKVYDENAGYYLSEQAVRPSAVKKLVNLRYHILARGDEIRVVNRLRDVVERVVDSTLSYSIIRLQKARD